MMDARIILTADNGGHPVEIRCAAIDVVQPVYELDFFRFSNVQVGARVYQVRETRDQIAALRAAAESAT